MFARLAGHLPQRDRGYVIAQCFDVRCYFTQSTGVYEDLPVNLFAACHFLVSNVIR